MLAYQQTPVPEIRAHLPADSGVRVWVKREDLNHPVVSGNKWWKLKYNLEEAHRQGAGTLLTFGGAWSNHLVATAAAARAEGFRSIGVIRGEEIRSLSPVLRFAEKQGMQLEFISRSSYRTKASPDFLRGLRQKFGEFYLLPEGGTNTLAVKGVAEFAASLFAGDTFTHVCCALGTGGTFAGLVLGKPPHVEAIGFPVLRGARFLEREVEAWTSGKGLPWWLCHDYHGGGYAKSTATLNRFMEEFTEETGIPVEPVYTGKMMWGIMDLIRQGRIPSGSRVLAVHTGGTSSLNSFEHPSAS